MSVPRDFKMFVSASFGFPVGEIKCLTADRSGTMGTYLTKKGVTAGSIYTSIALAEDSLTSGRNDVILVTPESHAWRGDSDATAAALTWDKTNTHVVGMDPESLGGYQRSRFGHAGYTMANFMTVSGASNAFKNIRWMHGDATGGASDVNCVIVSGAGNLFEKCCFGGPCDTTQSASGNYKGVTVSGSHNHFKNCLFGTHNSVLRGANSMLDFTGTGQGNVFEDCLFVFGAAGTTTEIIAWDSAEGTQGRITAMFLNCQFINRLADTYMVADAITCATLTEGMNNRLFFDSRCTFSGVTDVMVAGKENLIQFGHSTIAYDLSAATPDMLQLGLAMHPES